MINFSKMQALGNDFMVIDCITQKVNLNPNLVKKLADRNFGVGFDQLLLIEPPIAPDTDFHYRIFNSDGSEVGQCGNGARCFASFVIGKKLTNKRSIRVSTRGGEIVLEIKDLDSIKVNMGKPIWEPKLIPFTANSINKTYLINYGTNTVLAGVVSMGNPHCVIEVDNVDTHPVKEIGRQIEVNQRFPKKTNVPFYQILTKEHIKLRVFERGVGETLSCGTGACAAVAVAINQGQLSTDKPIRVDTRGGIVYIEWSGNHDHHLYITGDAKFVFDGKINIYAN